MPGRVTFNIPTPKSVGVQRSGRVTPDGNWLTDGFHDRGGSFENEVLVDWGGGDQVTACLGKELDRACKQRTIEKADDLLGKYWSLPVGSPPIEDEGVWKNFKVEDFVGVGKSSKSASLSGTYRGTGSRSAPQVPSRGKPFVAGKYPPSRATADSETSLGKPDTSPSARQYPPTPCYSS